MLVVKPGGPAVAADLRVGDRIVSFNGRAMQSRSDEFALIGSYDSGKPIALEIERGDQRLTISPVPVRVFFAASGIDSDVALILYGRIGLTFYLVSGIFLLLVRPNDPLVVVLGTAYLVVAVFAWPIPGGFTAAFRNLPAPAQALLWIPLFIESALLGFMGLWFSLNFPRPFLSRRWIWVLTTTALLFSPARLMATYRLIYDPNAATPLLFSTAWPGARIEIVLVALGETVFFVFNYLHLKDANERRRVRIVMAALVMILVSAVSYLVPMLFFPTSKVAGWVNSVLGLLVLFTAFSAAPVMMTYALIRHRLFDIRVMIRQGLRYAAARGVVLAVVPAAILLLAAEIARQSRLPLGDILQKHGWTYATIAGLAVAAHVMRKQWLDALDRRFFRERYNLHLILREAAEEIRNARSLETAGLRAVARIESALHSGFVAVMVREPGRPSYRPEAIAPAGVALPELPAGSKLMGAFRLFAKPLDLSSGNDWLQQQLPHAETDFLRQAEIELLVPISLGGAEREALLALGRKKSEEPYSSEDKELLLAIANNLALLLERHTASAMVASGLEECPRCGACYDTGIFTCPRDETPLKPSVVPRLLDGRYRLDRKLGRGGMGTVYSAFDTSLERQVALKLIREDLVSSAEAADRFSREARAAAAITHPNIVILHDFAVDADKRAFLVMELLSGTTLRQRLQQRGRIPQESLLEMERGICSALSVAHQRGLIHRDLKLENVFLVNDAGRDVPKVLDFGLAKFIAGTDLTSQPTMDTGAGVLLGTPQYMPPEQLNGQPVSAGWDLWSLAVMTYEMLTGDYPFGSPDSIGALHNAILTAPVAPVPEDLPHSAQWQEFFDRALHRDPLKRPASANEFLAACEQATAQTGG